MALVSFRIRRADSAGSALRQISVLDTALRSDSFVAAGDFVESTFEAYILNRVIETIVDNSRPNGEYTQCRSTVKLKWDLGTPLVSAPVAASPIGIYIVANTSGEPVTIEDGELVFTCNSTNYVSSYTHDSIKYRLNNFVYYSYFIEYSDGSSTWYERTATTYIQIPGIYNSLDNLWKRIPEYYRVLDQSEGNDSLYKFLELFGWELDVVRTTINSLSIINDPLTTPTVALDGLAKQLGLTVTSFEIGTAKLRNLLSNIFELRRQKGTAVGIASYISALSGCVCIYDEATTTFKVYTQRVNLVSDPKFRQQDVSFYTGSPSIIDRVPFALRVSTGGAALRNPDSNDDALRAYTSNPVLLGNLPEYTSLVVTDTVADIGWGVYTYGSAFNNANPIPEIEPIVYTAGAGAPTVVGANNDGLKITIPANAGGPQTVVVYGRKPFKRINNLTYYVSFDFLYSGATFVHARFIKESDIASFIEINPPDALGSALYEDTWNTTTAAVGNAYLRGGQASYNNATPGNATAGRAYIQHPEPSDGYTPEVYVVPALVFTANPGDSITIGHWMIEQNSFGNYFDGDTQYGGFIRTANQASVIGNSDYRWGASGGNDNEDFSYYTLDYGRVTAAVERIVGEELIPVNMLATYAVSWDNIQGE